MAETRDQAIDHTLGLIYLLENLSLIVHPQKTVKTSSQDISFLGIEIATTENKEGSLRNFQLIGVQGHTNSKSSVLLAQQALSSHFSV